MVAAKDDDIVAVTRTRTIMADTRNLILLILKFFPPFQIKKESFANALKR
jgi:hypothetical protein